MGLCVEGEDMVPTRKEKERKKDEKEEEGREERESLG